jgi:hypothetical protein
MGEAEVVAPVDPQPSAASTRGGDFEVVRRGRVAQATGLRRTAVGGSGPLNRV